jgi:hypothetical protein
MLPACIAAGEAAGGRVERAPWSGARDGFFGACDAGRAAAARGGDGTVVTGETGRGDVGTAETFGGGGTVTISTSDEASCPFGSGGGGFTLTPRLPMILSRYIIRRVSQ